MSSPNGYDPVEYWRQRTDPNHATGWQTKQLQPLLQWLRPVLAGKRTILDVGPGVGRCFPAYPQSASIVGYDVSPLYEKRLKVAAVQQRLMFQLVVGSEPAKLPWGVDAFDAVVCIQVLLHQPPALVERLMAELARVGKEVVAMAGINCTGRHVFHHDYPRIIQRVGWELIEDHHLNRDQLAFRYRRRREDA